MYYLYVLVNPSGRIYIGQTDNLDYRLEQHQNGEGGWTKSRGPWELFLHENYATRAEAMRREKALKSGRLNQELRRAIAQRGSTVERVLPRKD